MSKPFMIQGEAFNGTPFVLAAPTGGNQVTRIITKITMSTERDNMLDDTINTITLNGIQLARFVTNDNQIFSISLDEQFIIQRHNSVDQLAIYSTATPAPAEKTYITIQGVEVSNADDNDVDYLVYYFNQTNGAVSTIPASGNNDRVVVKQIVLDDQTAFFSNYNVTTSKYPNIAMYYDLYISNTTVSMEKTNIVIDNTNDSRLSIVPEINTVYSLVVFAVKIKV